MKVLFFSYIFVIAGLPRTPLCGSDLASDHSSCVRAYAKHYTKRGICDNIVKIVCAYIGYNFIKGRNSQRWNACGLTPMENSYLLVRRANSLSTYQYKEDQFEFIVSTKLPYSGTPSTQEYHFDQEDTSKKDLLYIPLKQHNYVVALLGRRLLHFLQLRKKCIPQKIFTDATSHDKLYPKRLSNTLQDISIAFIKYSKEIGKLAIFFSIERGDMILHLQPVWNFKPQYITRVLLLSPAVSSTWVSFSAGERSRCKLMYDGGRYSWLQIVDFDMSAKRGKTKYNTHNNGRPHTKNEIRLYRIPQGLLVHYSKNPRILSLYDPQTEITYHDLFPLPSCLSLQSVLPLLSGNCIMIFQPKYCSQYKSCNFCKQRKTLNICLKVLLVRLKWKEREGIDDYLNVLKKLDSTTKLTKACKRWIGSLGFKDYEDFRVGIRQLVEEKYAEFEAEQDEFFSITGYKLKKSDNKLLHQALLPTPWFRCLTAYHITSLDSLVISFSACFSILPPDVLLIGTFFCQLPFLKSPYKGSVSNSQ